MAGPGPFRNEKAPPQHFLEIRRNVGMNEYSVKVISPSAPGGPTSPPWHLHGRGAPQMRLLKQRRQDPAPFECTQRALAVVSAQGCSGLPSAKASMCRPGDLGSHISSRLPWAAWSFQK